MRDPRTFSTHGSHVWRGSHRATPFDLRRQAWLFAVSVALLLTAPAWPGEVWSTHSRVTSSSAPSGSHSRVVAEGRTSDAFRFETATSQVLVPVTVTDGDGRPVAGLGPEDFRLFEDGVEQRIDALLDQSTPLTLAIVVDVSASTRGKMEDAARALAELLDALAERDRTFLLGFHKWVVNLQEPTYDHSLLVEALSRFEPGDAMAMFDGSIEGLYRLHKMGPGTRRALVLLSDGFDNVSVNTPRETLAAAKATGIAIYTIGLGETQKGFFGKLFADPTKAELEGLDDIRLRELSASTGGRAYFVADIERRRSNGASSPLAHAFRRLARELRLQYVLTYRPPTSALDGQWHRINVELSRADLFARFRPGYLALPLEPTSTTMASQGASR